MDLLPSPQGGAGFQRQLCNPSLSGLTCINVCKTYLKRFSISLFGRVKKLIEIRKFIIEGHRREKEGGKINGRNTNTFQGLWS